LSKHRGPEMFLFEQPASHSQFTTTVILPASRTAGLSKGRACPRYATRRRTRFRPHGPNWWDCERGSRRWPRPCSK
jgi:hypothetical protein